MRQTAKTDPALVKEFVERSGCDILAVSIGNVHGLDAVAKIDLALLKRIAEVHLFRLCCMAAPVFRLIR